MCSSTLRFVTLLLVIFLLTNSLVLSVIFEILGNFGLNREEWDSGFLPFFFLEKVWLLFDSVSAMGNCLKTQKKSVAEINPFSPAEVKSFFQSESTRVLFDNNKGSSPVRKPVVKLYGPPNNAATFYIRFALLYKPVSLTFNHSEIVESPVLYYDSDVISGSVETMLRYLDSKFPNPPLLPRNGSFGWYDGTTPLMVWLLTLQHRSMIWHLERMERWAEDLASRGGKSRGDPVMGSPRMEMKKFGRGYSQLMDMLLEHARMEERVVFPILEKADRGTHSFFHCKITNCLLHFLPMGS